MIEAYKLGWRDEGFYIMSVGTGFIDGRIPYEEASKFRAIGETKKYINMARRQALRTQIKEAETVKKINPNFDFDRIDVQISKKHDVLDGVKFTAEYIKYAQSLIKECFNENMTVLRNLK
jgi:hypothetical protein